MQLLTDDERLMVENWRSVMATAALVGSDAIAANLTRESHLVGDADFGDPSEFGRFLATCTNTVAVASSIDASLATLLLACERFPGRGLRIPNAKLPPRLLRYTISENLIVDIATALLGTMARDAYHRGIYPIPMLMEDIRRSWRPTSLPHTLRLGRGEFVFATFVTAQLPVSAIGIAKALALPINLSPIRRDVAMFELEYDTNAVNDVRFPTIADAADCSLFVPAPDVEPSDSRPETWSGWTGALDGYPSQPEVLHRSVPLRVIATPPRFIGRAQLGGNIA